MTPIRFAIAMSSPLLFVLRTSRNSYCGRLSFAMRPP
jgi:hypothetical protein